VQGVKSLFTKTPVDELGQEGKGQSQSQKQESKPEKSEQGKSTTSERSSSDKITPESTPANQETRKRSRSI
jgi:hypothetical protein